MVTIQLVLVFAAFVCAVLSTRGTPALYVAVILLAIAELIQIWPR